MKGTLRSEPIKAILMPLLQDGKPHPISELRDLIVSRDANLIETPNSLNAALNYIMRHDPHLTRPFKAHYQYNISIPKSESMKSPLTQDPALEVKQRKMTSKEVIQRWTRLTHLIAENLKAPTYDMSLDEFQEYKKINDINVKILQVLGEYSEKN